MFHCVDVDACSHRDCDVCAQAAKRAKGAMELQEGTPGSSAPEKVSLMFMRAQCQVTVATCGKSA